MCKQSKSIRLDEEIIDIVNSCQVGENFTEKLEYIVSLYRNTRNEECNTKKRNTKNEECNTLDFYQRYFLDAFIRLNIGHFCKWWTINQDVDFDVMGYFRCIQNQLLGKQNYTSDIVHSDFERIRNLLKLEFGAIAELVKLQEPTAKGEREIDFI